MYDEAYTCIQLLIEITISADHEVIFIIISSIVLGGPLSPLFCDFVRIIFFHDGAVSLTPNPQPGGPGYPFLSGLSPLTSLAIMKLRSSNHTTKLIMILERNKEENYLIFGSLIFLGHRLKLCALF
jgi:hypothetical protein